MKTQTERYEIKIEAVLTWGESFSSSAPFPHNICHLIETSYRAVALQHGEEVAHCFGNTSEEATNSLIGVLESLRRNGDI